MISTRELQSISNVSLSRMEIAELWSALVSFPATLSSNVSLDSSSMFLTSFAIVFSSSWERGESLERKLLTSKLSVVVSSFLELSMVIILAGIRGVMGRERVTPVRGSSNGKTVADKPAGQTCVSLLLKSVESGTGFFSGGPPPAVSCARLKGRLKYKFIIYT